MGKLGGLRGLVIAMVLLMAGLTLPASSVGAPSPSLPNVSLSASTESQQIMVCVDWETKEVKYSKYWRFCPNKHKDIMLGVQGPQGETGLAGPRGPSGATGARGPAGADGATTSLWDSLPSCWAKLSIARNANYLFALKSERDAFEAATGCVVEETRDTRRIQTFVSAGLPVISEFEVVSASAVTEGDLISGFNAVSNGVTTIRVKIANYLWISNFGTDSYGDKAWWCSVGGSRGFTNLGDGEFLVERTLSGGTFSLATNVQMGYSFNRVCRTIDYVSDDLALAIDVDPTILVGLNDATWNTLLTRWGWR